MFGEIDNSVIWTGTSNPPGSFGVYTWAQGYWFNAHSHLEGRFNQKGPVDEMQFREHRTFRSDHPQVVQFCMVDGSIRIVPETTDRMVLEQLLTRNGGEIIRE